MTRAPYHRVQALLGRGDLHPGGESGSQRLIGWISEVVPVRVLEIGAGAGLSTQRMRARGWEVTALEPDPVLASRLKAVDGVRVMQCGVESLEPEGDAIPFDAVLAESVLYGTDLPVALARIRAVLRPGGILALSEMVWAPGTSAELAARTHDESLRRYGIAGTSRTPWAWNDWRQAIHEAGFELAREECLGEGSPGGATDGGRRGALRGLLARPGLILDLARHRLVLRGEALDNRYFESWRALARRR